MLVVVLIGNIKSDIKKKKKQQQDYKKTNNLSWGKQQELYNIYTYLKANSYLYRTG